MINPLLLIFNFLGSFLYLFQIIPISTSVDTKLNLPSCPVALLQLPLEAPSLQPCLLSLALCLSPC